MTGFPITMAMPPTFGDPLPVAADLIVIGGGVIGVTAALFAARRGLRVVLCEKGRIAGEQSGRNWGWICQQGRDLGELPIVTEAMRHWQSFDIELGGDRLGLRTTGILYPARDAATLARHEAWLAAARPFDVDSHLLSAAEVRAEAPGVAGDLAGGLLTPSDGRAEPWVAVPLLARLAQARGVVLREDCAVRSLDIAAGQIAGVETEHGRIAAPQVILAAGAWSRLFLRPHGVRVPQLSVLASVARTEGAPGLFAGGWADGAYAYRTRADGGLTIAANDEHDFYIGPDAFASLRPYLPTLWRDFRATRMRPWAPRGFPDAWGQARRWSAPSPFEITRMLDPRPSRRTLERALTGLRRAFPGAAGLRLGVTWAGMIDTMPDVVPIVDRVPGLSGLILATGMAGHGFGIGPGFGRVLADMAAGVDPGHDLRRFRFDRFSDGSAIDFGAAL